MSAFIGHDSPKHTNIIASSISAAIAHPFSLVHARGPNILDSIRTMIAPLSKRANQNRAHLHTGN
ncbi:MAG: hypothetical protein ACLT98_03610, partial [Eggerthellaceae bacterium]